MEWTFWKLIFIHMYSKFELAAVTFKFFAFFPLSLTSLILFNNNMGQQFFPQCTRGAFVCAFEDILCIFIFLLGQN